MHIRWHAHNIVNMLYFKDWHVHKSLSRYDEANRVTRSFVRVLNLFTVCFTTYSITFTSLGVFIHKKRDLFLKIRQYRLNYIWKVMWFPLWPTVSVRKKTCCVLLKNTVGGWWFPLRLKYEFRSICYKTLKILLPWWNTCQTGTQLLTYYRL